MSILTINCAEKGMSHIAEADEVGSLEFKWLKKRGVGGKKKEVQFYESFLYEGMEYTLYDCVYMYMEGLPEPYIGKLIKIWEHSGRTKKVKVQWFFRPWEILKWLGDNKALENEIFLASGEGVGLANVNPLEAIAGKCNVVCISKDSRNPQPSDEELKMADYIFYCTFDVQSCTVLEKMDDKVGGLEIQYIFNRKESENASSVPKVSSDRKVDNKNTTACHDKMEIFTQNPPDNVNVDLKQDSITKDVKDPLAGRESLTGLKPASGVGDGLSEVATTSAENGSTRSKVENEDDIKVSKVVNQVGVKERTDSAKVSDPLEDKASKKAGVDNSIRLSKEKKKNSDEKLPLHENDVKALVTTVISEEKLNYKHGKDSLNPDKGMKSGKDSGDLEGRPSKKARIDSSLRLTDGKNRNSVQKLSTNYEVTNTKDLVLTATSSEEKPKSILALDSHGMKKVPKKEQPDEKTRRLSNGKLTKVSALESADEDKETAYQEFEVTGKPDADKSKWFRALPWEERMRSAREQGTLVLLRNLDTEYTSGEVEGVIWHAFKETCTAKMVQRNAISSPHSGQAFVIFKTKEAAERVIRKLDVGCLMLSNGKPIVGSTCPPPSLSGKQSTFFGHLVIDKIKLQSQREMKDAVSTSHCSQPNTIEFEMAMDWCVLQSRSEKWWTTLYKQQREELIKLEANLKRKRA